MIIHPADGRPVQMVELHWEPDEMLKRFCRCPRCGTDLVGRDMSDGTLRLRTLKLDLGLTPTDRDEVPFGDAPVMTAVEKAAEEAELAAEFAREKIIEGSQCSRS
jgi:hypothetical protein